MSDKIVAIGVTPVAEQDKENLLKTIDGLRERIVEGQIIGVVAVGVKPDRKYAIWQSGDIRQVESIGVLMMAVHDLQHEDEPA